jgi:hypothetical protein
MCKYAAVLESTVVQDSGAASLSLPTLASGCVASPAAQRAPEAEAPEAAAEGEIEGPHTAPPPAE